MQFYGRTAKEEEKVFNSAMMTKRPLAPVVPHAKAEHLPAEQSFINKDSSSRASPSCHNRS